MLDGKVFSNMLNYGLYWAALKNPFILWASLYTLGFPLYFGLPFILWAKSWLELLQRISWCLNASWSITLFLFSRIQKRLYILIAYHWMTNFTQSNFPYSSPTYSAQGRSLCRRLIEWQGEKRVCSPVEG